MSENQVDIQTGGVSVKESETKWLSIILIAVGILMGVSLFLLNSDNQQIHHRLDVRDAYFNKGLIDSAKQSQEAYKKEHKLNLGLAELCRSNGVQIPINLTPEPEINFKPVDSILMEEPQTGGK